VSGPLRIFSDLHFGHPACRVRSLEQLRPLFAGASALFFNGDTCNTQYDIGPAATTGDRATVRAFFSSVGLPATFLTGNHDPDIVAEHAWESPDGRIFVTHGDILFSRVIPWGWSARGLRAQLAASPPAFAETLWRTRLEAFRRKPVLPAQGILKFAVARRAQRLRFIFRAWCQTAERAARFVETYRPQARFILIGHTHQPGIWTPRPNLVVINTGSLCRPFGALAVDLRPDCLEVRRIEAPGDEFRLGPVIAAWTRTG
jgi:predicted phosphodiesterase